MVCMCTMCVQCTAKRAQYLELDDVWMLLWIIEGYKVVMNTTFMVQMVHTTPTNSRWLISSRSTYSPSFEPPSKNLMATRLSVTLSWASCTKPNAPRLRDLSYMGGIVPGWVSSAIHHSYLRSAWVQFTIACTHMQRTFRYRG